MEQIRDMLYVKRLERRIKRRLSEEEMDGQPFTVRRPNGSEEEHCVPVLKFPWDLISEVVLSRVSDDSTLQRLTG